MTYSWPVRDSSLRSLCLYSAQAGKQVVRKALVQPYLPTLLLDRLVLEKEFEQWQPGLVLPHHWFVVDADIYMCG